MYTVYILKCADNSLYTGIARDITKRLTDHQTKKGSKYVRARLPFKLVYSESQPDRSTATKREIQIKNMTRKEKLILIDDC
jgi:putative endonuclease